MRNKLSVNFDGEINKLFSNGTVKCYIIFSQTAPSFNLSVFAVVKPMRPEPWTNATKSNVRLDVSQGLTIYSKLWVLWYCGLTTGWTVSLSKFRLYGYHISQGTICCIATASDDSKFKASEKLVMLQYPRVNTQECFTQSAVSYIFSK